MQKKILKKHKVHPQPAIDLRLLSRCAIGDLQIYFSFCTKSKPPLSRPAISIRAKRLCSNYFSAQYMKDTYQ